VKLVNFVSMIVLNETYRAFSIRDCCDELKLDSMSESIVSNSNFQTFVPEMIVSRI